MYSTIKQKLAALFRIKKVRSRFFGRSDDAGIYEGNNKEMLIQSSDWYKEVKDANGRVVYFDSDLLDHSPDTFSSVKLFRDSGSPDGEPIGLIIVNLCKSIFGSVFNDSSLGSYMAINAIKEPDPYRMGTPIWPLQIIGLIAAAPPIFSRQYADPSLIHLHQPNILQIIGTVVE